MADHIRIGLIGYGGWPRAAYVPALRSDGRARVTAVAAPSEATRQRAASELGAGVALFTDAPALLASGSADAVMVAVSEPAHGEAIGAAIAAGVPTLYEPPLTDAVAETPAMIELLEKATAPTHADIELSFLPVVAAMREMVTSGRLGKVRQALCRLSASWGASGELCAANHLAPWFIDPLDRVLGATAERVLALDGSGNASGAQPQCVAMLDYGGVWGNFRSNTDGHEATRIIMEVIGSEGEVTADLMRGHLLVRDRSTGDDGALHKRPPLQPILELPGMHESVRLFLDAVESGSEAADAAGAGRLARLYRLGLAVEESKRNGTWATVHG